MDIKNNRLTKKEIDGFKRAIYSYYSNHGRNLPWRRTREPYHILVSEIMLQQTQVDRVITKYNQFIQEFPTLKKLAKSPFEKVLRNWQGLGYNRRALMIHRCAQAIMKKYKGVIPDNTDKLQKLPGIGRATAASICVFAFNKPLVFIETNIRTVFIHEFFPGQNDIADNELIPLINQTLDTKSPCKWYSALMDYGAYLKKNYTNPSRQSAHHTKQSRFEGSDRQIRGKILRLLLSQKRLAFKRINNELHADPQRLKKILQDLVKEGFIIYSQRAYLIASDFTLEDLK